MREAFSQADYSAFLALFDQEHTLVLGSMRIHPSARRVLSQVAQDCLAHGETVLPDGSLIRLLNVQQILKQQAPYVALSAEDGVAVLPAYQFEHRVSETLKEA